MVVHEVAVRLARAFDVVVYTGSYRGSRSGTRDGVRYVHLPVGWAGPRGGQILFQLLLPFVALLRRPAVWIETLSPPFSASPLPVVYRRRVVALVQMLSGADMARKYRLPFHLVERRALRLYRHFVTLNEVDRQAIVRYARPAGCHLVPNGVHRPVVAEDEFGAGGHLLFLGRVDVQQKGLDLLLEALRRVPAGMPLVIAGSGVPAEERRLRRLVEAAGADVTMAGRVTGAEKEKLIRSCAAMVVPSRFETFSLAALEAMAHGKPVVCFDLPQLRWMGDDCVVRVPPFDVPALGRALRDLVADPRRRAELGRRGYDFSRNHDWEVIGERYRALIDELIGPRTNTPPARRE
ncbi:hypothetical protein Ade02nite_68990 [Paractinoplanes deccanensis]|uniref:Glycosyltransferase n=1 Tax=Paractinoplanes deccanensis TaxID=113561 RepID=A0ABQ3YE30_9ACTN|nr:hypothetical protein Ade02nite_68990 [Actinoplanes deccanensis]